jgi:hypothetical protein
VSIEPRSQQSGLPQIIAKLGSPRGLAVWKSPLMVLLYSRHALEISLHLILRKWIPRTHRLASGETIFGKLDFRVRSLTPFFYGG